MGDAGSAGDSHDAYAARLEAAGITASSRAATTGTAGAGQGGNFSRLVLGERGTGRYYSFSAVMATGTGSALVSLAERP